jgi:hypothetical protein
VPTPQILLRNGANRSLLVSAKAPAEHARGFGMETKAKESRAQANGDILAGAREGKMEIPAYTYRAHQRLLVTL